MARHKLLNAVAATGAGASITLAKPISKHTYVIDITDANGGISAITVALEHTHDGRQVADADAKWFVLDTYAFQAADLTALGVTRSVDGKPAKRVRLNITALTGNGTGDSIDGIYIPGVV